MEDSQSNTLFESLIQKGNIWKHKHIWASILVLVGLMLPAMLYVRPTNGFTVRSNGGLEIRRNTVAAPSSSLQAKENRHSPKYLIHKVKAGQSLYRIAQSYGMSVDELMRLNQLTQKIIQPEQKLLVATEGKIHVSWYGEWFNHKPMSNGEPYHIDRLVIAHRYLPLGTCVELSNPENGKRVVAQVKDRIAERFAHRWDVSPRIFSQELDIHPGVGVASLEYQIVDCDLYEGEDHIALKK